MSHIGWAGLLAVVVAFGPAFAQDAAPPRHNRTIDLLDTSGDGKAELKEVVDEHNRLFGAADVDGDGRLSVEEFRRRGRLFMSLRTTTMFDLLDVNGDQTLSPEEVSAPAKRWFKRYDTNHDGALEVDELPNWERGGRDR